MKSNGRFFGSLSRAFTLVEVMIVLVILGILGAIVISQINSPSNENQPQYVTIYSRNGNMHVSDGLILTLALRPNVRVHEEDIQPGVYMAVVRKPVNNGEPVRFGLSRFLKPTEDTIRWASDIELVRLNETFLFEPIHPQSRSYPEMAKLLEKESSVIAGPPAEMPR